MYERDLSSTSLNDWKQHSTDTDKAKREIRESKMPGGVGCPCPGNSRMAAATSWTTMMMILAVAIWVSHADADHAGTVHAAESSLSPDARTLLALKTGIEDPNGVLDDWVESVPSGSGSEGGGSGSRRRGSVIGTSPCNWTAVLCDSGGSVITLNLSKLNLSGNISGAIGSLAHLSTLSLDSNNFSGPIPREISLLSHLRFLNITNNSFSSELPPGLSNLTRLEVLDCYNNYLSGQLPVELVALRNLKHLHLGGNNFQGSIPSAYGNLSTGLDYLSLSGNLLTGSIPPELGNLTSLTHLYLGWYNSFQGGVPPELGQLNKLALLDLSSCRLTGRMPAELSNLAKLESLFFYSNNLSGPLPPEWGSLKNLKSLDVSINNLVGPIPDSFGNMTNLTLLNVMENFLDGEMPPTLGDLPNLQVLQVWMNNFTGEMPRRLGRSGRLVELDVSNNLLKGTVPPDLCLGGRLQILITKSNRLSGAIPAGVGNCPSLNYIRMHDNQLSGAIPANFFKLPSITMLQLQGNFFSGSIPSDMEAPLLRTVYLSQNQLEGSIPESVGNLSSLQTLHMGRNRLTGPIPSRICDMPALYEIELGSNALGGEIPASLGNCSALSLLDLSWNELTGPIPGSLMNLDVLAILDLSNNRLSGPILEGLGLIQSLTQVDFSYNNFSGPVPTSGNSENYNESSYEGNPLLCGGEGLPSCGSGNNGSNSTPSSGGPNNNRTAPGGPETWTGTDGGPSLLAWLVGALFAVAVLVVFLGMWCFCKRYRFHILRILRKDRSGVRPWKFTPFQRLDFTAAEIVDCLSDENIIGRGGAGIVYRGEMASGDMVAVKRLACQGKGTSHDHGFSAEIRTLGKIRHRFIVRLLGFCTNNQINLLVYEYMPNGSLGEFLHDGKKSGLLDWTTRYNIALQAATGLCYLHHDCSPLIVHRDVKSNNILLDSNLEAHVADFGLAKLFQGSGKSESMSSIAGSYGYIAPEYAYTLKVNEKSDIYSFGVVLMELLTGKRPIEAEFGDGVDIVQWVRLKIQTKEGVLKILDPRIGGTAGAAAPGGGAPGSGTGSGTGAGDNGGLTAPVPLQEVMLVLRVALLCSSDHPADRPTMRDVVQMLSDVRPPVRTGSMDSRELKSQSSSAALTDDLLTF